MDRFKSLICLLLVTLTLSACSTRQAGEKFSGSTEQRLVTYSINEIAKGFAKEPLQLLIEQPIFIESHFVVKNEVVNYAEARIKSQLAESFKVKFVDGNQANTLIDYQPANYKLDLFFTSLGTDRDQAGFSFPIINLSEPERSTSISVLAVDMYHGISECHYVLVDLKTQEIMLRGKVSSRVRTDKFTTPIFSFPLSDLD
ncbi:hypothetical protein [Catenovulum sediminis]|uniref:DUF4251 domain-containing protein n=1 Tax=Catenovulum sediminis TaxID=1740262 RepID=A0ABV1RJK4_9ALTE|nr:hypothetical protein [Catenovulum sediminis]